MKMKGGDKPMVGRLWNRAWNWLAFSAILIGFASTSHAQSEPKNLKISGFQLIKETELKDNPYFRFTVVGTDENGIAVPISIRGELEKHLRVLQTSPVQKIYEPFYAVAASADSAVQNKRYIMVVFDVSGSMLEPIGKTRKFEAAKEAVKGILNQFRPGIDYIAIVPFESHQVVSQIQKAQFVSDRQSADMQLNNLPIPNTGNTGLFSAVQTGIRVLSGIKESGAERSMIVMTDGQNDVKKDKGDDTDLIEGVAVPKELIDEISTSQMAVYTIGFGGRTIDEPAMRKIAAPHQDNYLSAPDAQTLAKQFGIVKSYGINNIRLLIAPDEKRFRDLNGVNRSFKVQLTLSSGHMLESSEEVTYRPPITGDATTAELASADEIPKIPDNTEGAGGDRDTSMPPWIPFLSYAALIALLWFVVPRFLWPENAIPEQGYAAPKASAAPAARASASAPAAASYSAAGWRTQSGQTGRTTGGGRLTRSTKTNVGPDDKQR
jgi:Mg-chelatase subunit ChlD